MRKKITVVGEGNAAHITARDLLFTDLCDTVLLNAPAGVAEDLCAAAVLGGCEPRLRSGNWDDAAASDVVVLLDGGIGEAAAPLTARCPGAIIVVASAEPLVAVARVLEATRFPPGRVIGVGPRAAWAGGVARAATERRVSARDAAASAVPAAVVPGPWSTAAAVREVVEAVLRDARRRLPCVVGRSGGAVSAADALIGAAGVEEV